MKNDDARYNRRWVLLVMASFMVFASAVVLRLGIGATPYDARDSLGRPMGFNDPLYAEHYVMMIRNFRFKALFQWECAYEWLLLAAHLVGAAILLFCDPLRARMARWFFLAQWVLFAGGILALPFLPFLVMGFLTGPMDREGFIDIPFIVAVAHPVWVITSLIIVFALRGTGLGLSRFRGSVPQADGKGVGVFARAVR